VKKTQLAKLKMGAAPLVLGIALISAPAYAQDAEEGADEGEIVVTGTLVRNPNLEASSPVNVTTEEEILLRQGNSAELLLRETPGIVPNLGSNVNNGQVGASRVDLRGLGSNRNIVMLNSTRIVPGSFVGAVDLNNIPVALVQRVDVLTGGASTTYGADAVTGVVNFITKRDFSGLDVSVSQALSERGDANQFRADVTIGANFDDGRGNAVISIGYIGPVAVRPASVWPVRAQLADRPVRRRFADGSPDLVRYHGSAGQPADQPRRQFAGSAICAVQLQPQQHLCDAI
jgi:iron complex outermembrane recepter protein